MNIYENNKPKQNETLYFSPRLFVDDRIATIYLNVNFNFILIMQPE